MVGSSANNLTSMLMQALLIQGGSSKKLIDKKLIPVFYILRHQIKEYKTNFWMVDPSFHIFHIVQLFLRSLKRHLWFSKLAKVMETKGVKTVKNVKINWIYVLIPTRHIMSKYTILLMKMGIDGFNNYKAKANFDLFHDVQIMLGLLPYPLSCAWSSQLD